MVFHYDAGFGAGVVYRMHTCIIFREYKITNVVFAKLEVCILSFERIRDL